MARPISGDYRHARRLLSGVADPSGLNLAFQLDGNRVFCTLDATRERCGRSRTVPPALLQGMLDDLGHASLAALQKRVGITRESRLRFLKPLYTGGPFRVDGTIPKSAADVVTVQARYYNDKEQLCVEGAVEIFLLSAEAVRRMTKDGMIPQELRRFF